MTYAFQLQTQGFLSFRNQRVIEADALDKTAIATIARIRYHHIEKRTILRTAAGKTNDYHIKPLISPAKGRGFYDILGGSCKPGFLSTGPPHACASTIGVSCGGSLGISGMNMATSNWVGSIQLILGRSNPQQFCNALLAMQKHLSNELAPQIGQQ